MPSSPISIHSTWRCAAMSETGRHCCCRTACWRFLLLNLPADFEGRTPCWNSFGALSLSCLPVRQAADRVADDVSRRKGANAANVALRDEFDQVEADEPCLGDGALNQPCHLR